MDALINPASHGCSYAQNLASQKDLLHGLDHNPPFLHAPPDLYLRKSPAHAFQKLGKHGKPGSREQVGILCIWNRGSTGIEDWQMSLKNSKWPRLLNYTLVVLR
jgi:hypothetical protein